MADVSDATAILSCLLAHLPLHAEEGTLREVVPEDMLIDACGAHHDESACRMLIALMRRQFEALALLDRVELAQGHWAFVSFPAAMFARSLLATLGTPNQAILPVDYWEQGEHRPPELVDEQRHLLHRIEAERVRQSPDAPPVRIVHVAWAFIRFGDRFLLHRREDKERPGEKTHVLPGGRFNISDLPAEVLKQGAAVLRQVASVDSQLVDANLDATLVRELGEELGLRHSEDYQFQRWQRLPSFRQVAGVGNRHAYSEYAFQLYSVRLTPSGEVRLLDREAATKKLVWFSAAEIVQPFRRDGMSAYVDALHAAWGAELAERLAHVPESGASVFAFAGETQMLDLPDTVDAGVVKGKPGKESVVEMALDELAWKLLLLLGWHARGFQIDAASSVKLLGGGWVRFDDAQSELACNNLQAKLQATGLALMEIRDRHYARLSISPEILMLGSGLYTYAIEHDERDAHAPGFLVVSRDAVSTPWGALCGASRRLTVQRNTLGILRALECGEAPDGDPKLLASNWEKNLRDQVQPHLREIGLRKLWTSGKNAVGFVPNVRRLPEGALR